ncbi:MAG: FHIPEP family type III secretion protein [Nannocystaceae bacterium]
MGRWDRIRGWWAGRGWGIAGSERASAWSLGALGGVAVLVALMVCLLIPVATGVVDLLLALSLSISLILVVASLRVERPTQLRWFPSMVLCATLFRLCINVSTTRLILSDGYAGEVVAAFAGAVVRRDLVIGGVIFVIITAVQFLVITRGASRMAEVAARFALDALPGHQGSIRDQASHGRITAAEAIDQQAQVLSRADFYGAMDGTSRFVRGDAVVGVLIVVVNLVGGIVVGTTRRGMGLLESLDVYGRLTIGDGLLAQIPALLVSLAAALLVARVEDRSSGRATAIIPRDPLIFAAPAATLTVLAMWDGMPTLIFSSVALALFGVALVGAFRGSQSAAGSGRTRGLCVELPRGTSSPSPETLRAYRRRLIEECGVDPGVVSVLWLEGENAQPRVRYRGRVLGSVEVSPTDAEATMLRAVHAVVRRQAHCLFDIEEMQQMVVRARRVHGALSEAALEGVELKDIQHALAGFLSGGLPVPPLEEWLHALAEGGEFRDPARREYWVEDLRRRTASWWWLIVSTPTEAAASWIRLSPDFELELRETISRDPGGEWRFTCDPTTAREVTATIRECASTAGPQGVLICQPQARARAEWIARRADAPVFVVSTTELDEALPTWDTSKTSSWVPAV